MGGRLARATVLGLLGAGVVAACAVPDFDAAGPAPDDVVAPVPPAPSVEAPPEPEAPRPRHEPGVYPHEVNVAGQVRRWTTVVPPDPTGTGPVGLVVVLHGVGGRGIDMRPTTGFDSLAANRGVVMAYPDALGGAWNDGRPGADPWVPNVNVDDLRFIRLLIEATQARTGFPPRRVAVVGFSNGAVMAGRVSCDLADHVAAVVLVGGSAGQGFEQSCRPSRRVSAMVVAGSDDPIVPYAGGKVADIGSKTRGFVAPVDAFVAFWARRNGCTSTGPLPASPQVNVVRGINCGGETAVQRYRVAGGGHEWFRPPRFATTEAIWDFVSRRFPLAPDPSA